MVSESVPAPLWLGRPDRTPALCIGVAGGESEVAHKLVRLSFVTPIRKHSDRRFCIIFTRSSGYSSGLSRADEFPVSERHFQPLCVALDVPTISEDGKRQTGCSGQIFSLPVLVGDRPGARVRTKHASVDDMLDTGRFCGLDDRLALFNAPAEVDRGYQEQSLYTSEGWNQRLPV